MAQIFIRLYGDSRRSSLTIDYLDFVARLRIIVAVRLFEVAEMKGFVVHLYRNEKVFHPQVGFV